jgi:hypothetical protein
MKFLETIKPRVRGADGKKLQLNASQTHLQWRLEGDSTWNDLASLDSLATFAMPKSGGAFTGNIQVRNIIETLVVPAGVISGMVGLDLSLGNVFDLSLAGNIANFNIINFPEVFAGQAALSFTMFLRQNNTNVYGVDFEFSVNSVAKNVLWPGGFVPTVSTTLGAMDIFSFLTFDAGENWFGFVGGQNY